MTGLNQKKVKFRLYEYYSGRFVVQIKCLFGFEDFYPSPYDEFCGMKLEAASEKEAVEKIKYHNKINPNKTIIIQYPTIKRHN